MSRKKEEKKKATMIIVGGNNIDVSIVLLKWALIIYMYLVIYNNFLLSL